MRVAVFASGEGYGHVGRCLGVAEELSRRGHEVQLCTYGTAARKASDEGWKVTPVPSEVTYVEEDGRLYLMRSALASWDFPLNATRGALESASIARESDVVLVDNYMGGLFAGVRNRLPTFSHFNCAHPASGFVSLSGAGKVFELMRRFQVWLYDRLSTTLVVDFPPPNTVAKYNIESFLSHPLFTGPLVRQKPSGLPSEVKIRKELGLDRFILVARGGYAAMSDINPALDKVGEEVGKEVVVLDPPSKEYSNLTLREFTPETYFKLLKACDAVLTHGGHTTLMECCAFGKATALLISDDHGERMRNGKGVEELGVGKVLPFSSANPESIGKLISEALELKEKAKKMKKLAEGRWGAEWESDLLEKAGEKR